MKKERLFPYWTDLKRVIPIAQTQSVNNFALTLVSIETYAVYGFLLTVNVEAKGQSSATERSGRGWTRASIVDQNRKEYTSLLATISGVLYGSSLFRGRAVMICMPPLADQATEVLITIDSIEWEFTDDDAALPASEVVQGPWVFHVSL